MTRRSKVSIGILLVLLCVLAAICADRWNDWRKQQAHQQAFDDWGREFAQANRRMAADGRALLPENAPPDAEIVPGPNARFQPVDLLWKKSDWMGKLLTTVGGCQPIAPDTDLVWAGSNLFLMRERGRLEHIWPESNEASAIRNIAFDQNHLKPCFDGRYVWIVSPAHFSQSLTVLDPLSREVWEFGSEATGLFSRGMPQATAPGAGLSLGRFQMADSASPASLMLAPVRPGVVCALFQGNDPWLALLEFDPQDNSREVVELELPKSLVLRTDNSTTPRFFPLDATLDGRPSRRIVLTRQGLPPLVIDPETRQIASAHPSSLQEVPWASWCAHNGAIWSQSIGGFRPTGAELRCTALPEMQQQSVLYVPSALLGSDGKRLLLVGEECWQLDEGRRRLERLNADCFWTYYDATPRSVRWKQSEPIPPSVLARLHPAAPTFDDLFAVPAAEQTAPGRTWRRPVRMFPSAVYGLLIETNTWNFSTPQLCSLTIDESAANAENATPAEVSPTEPAATVSRLNLTAARADARGTPRRLALMEAPVEPQRIGWHERLPVLAREIVRQSLWLAAQSADYAARDGSLGESLPDDVELVKPLLLSSWFRNDGSGEVSLRENSDDEPGPLVWRGRLQLLNDAGMLDYLKLVEKAEAWSRDDFHRLLAEKSAANDHRIIAAQSVETDADSERQLGEMTLTAQFAAIQRCSNIPSSGKGTGACVGGLVRGYATLGLLTHDHWTSASKTFQARALLYAQRMVAASGRSAEALRHRAFAEAMAGLPQAALNDLAQAEQSENANPAPAISHAPWVDVITAACRSDGEALAVLSQGAEAGQLAALLRYLPLSRMQQSVLAAQAARDTLERQPECLRVYDAMFNSASVDDLQASTIAALEVCQQRLPARLRGMPGLPAAAAARLDAEQDDGTAIERAATALFETADSESSGLSWQALGGLIRETLFQVCWRRAHLICFWTREGADDFLKTAALLVPHHSSRRLFDFYGQEERLAHTELDQRQKSAAVELLENLRLADMKPTQQQIYEFFFGRGWQAHRPGLYAAAVWRPEEHLDGVLTDLLDQLDDDRRARLFSRQGGEGTDYYRGSAQWHEFVRQANALSPASPEVVAAAVRHNYDLSGTLYDQIVKRYANQPCVVRALAQIFDIRDPRGREALQKYVKLSPDPWAYQALANGYLQAGNLDLWQAMLDDYLARVDDQQAAASVRVEMANVLIGRGEWTLALPYAEEAAKKKSEAAMAALIRCYQGLGEDELEGDWHERIVDRYPGAAHAREYYLWSRRTGLRDAQRLRNDAMLRIGPQQPFAPADEQIRYAAFYWLARRPDDAIRCYELASSMADHAAVTAFAGLCIALLSEEKGDTGGRDQALADVAALGDADVKHYQELAKWLGGLADKKLSRDVAEQLSMAAPFAEKPATDYLLGYAFLLAGQTKDALTYLERSATSKKGANATSRTMASAVLRDRGLVPGKLGEAAE